MLSKRTPLGLKPRLNPQQTRSITVESEGANRPADGRLIPWPEAPCYPILTDLGQLAGRGSGGHAGGYADILAAGPALLTTSGTTALGWAFKALSLEPGTRVLMPAYHCLAMIEPLAWLGLKPVFYKLNEDLSIDYDDIERRLDKTCKTLVAVHYFGFPQDGPRLRAFCDEFGLALVEDCCHSFFHADNGQPLGNFGDYAVGSLPKFFPLHGGGCLVSSRRRLPQEALRAPGPLTDLRALVRDLQMSHYYGRLRALTPLTTATAALCKLLLLAGMQPEVTNPGSSRAGMDFSAGRVAQRVLAACDPDSIAAKRRHNYETICRSLADLPAVSLMKPTLEAGVVPYMVPLRIPALRGLFAALEDRAVPMQRFGQFLSTELDEEFCPVSTDLSFHGLQIPCHQSLRPEEIDWMTGQLREVCQRAEAG